MFLTIDKEKIDRKWPASSGRQFRVVLSALNVLVMSAFFIKNHQTFHLHILNLRRDSTSIHLVYNHVLSRLSYRNRPSVSSLVSTFSMDHAPLLDYTDKEYKY